MEDSKIQYKSTNNLDTELNNESSLKDFLEKNETEFLTIDLGQLIQTQLDKKKIGKAELARRSGMSTVYLYQLISGKRFPSRDRLLCLCIGLACSLNETQDMLRKSGFATLYLKVRRDAVITYGIRNELNINQINDLLYESEEETLI